ncbi:UNVERIFIED_CONTAM: hypothetical protein PYX00_008496 [Menopon gallinae]|uniref:Uncharacterized protein n=1 Tax=Menopon gallinae TaxID=328185 RepID=A0AAW2HNH7_9NEOP
MEWPEEVFKKCKLANCQSHLTVAQRDQIIICDNNDEENKDILKPLTKQIPFVNEIVWKRLIQPSKIIQIRTSASILIDDPDEKSEPANESNGLSILAGRPGRDPEKPENVAIKSLFKQMVSRPERESVTRAIIHLPRSSDLEKMRKLLETALMDKLLEVEIARNSKKKTMRREIPETARGSSIFIHPKNGCKTTFAQIVGELKGTIKKPSNEGVKITSKGDRPESQKNFIKSVQEKVKSAGEIILREKEKKLLIKDLDESTKRE